MTNSPTAIPNRNIRRANADKTMARLHVVQCASTAYCHQISDHDNDREERRRRPEGQVPTRSDVVVDDVGSELRGPSHNLYGDVVTEAEREREDRTGDD